MCGKDFVEKCYILTFVMVTSKIGAKFIKVLRRFALKKVCYN